MATVSKRELQKMLHKNYRYKQQTSLEVTNVISQYRDLKPVLDTYVFSDGSAKDLMNLSGTIPVSYKGNVYNIPICLWLMDTYPYSPPICFVKPTSTMRIKTGKHVDPNGKIYLPYLHEWKPPHSDLFGLIQVMIVMFGEEPPVFSCPAMPQHMQQSPALEPENCLPKAPSQVTEINWDTIHVSKVLKATKEFCQRTKEKFDAAQAELDALKKTEDDLRKGRQKLEKMLTQLRLELVEVDKEVEALKQKDTILQTTVESQQEEEDT